MCISKINAVSILLQLINRIGDFENGWKVYFYLMIPTCIIKTSDEHCLYE